MLITITTTHQPATDLGFVLRKHPDNVRTVSLPFGTAHVFWPEASAARASAALLVEVDAHWLTRRVRGSSRPLEPYVNDRSYVASSLASVALRRVYGSAMGGATESDEHAELAQTSVPLEVEISAIRASDGPALAAAVFAPLGYVVEATPLGEGSEDAGLFSLRLTGTQTVADLLNHLYVLLPVLDDNKHYWVGAEEIDKLLAHGEGWLADHPERETVTKRYLRHRGSLVKQALAGLDEGPTVDEEAADAHADEVRPPSLKTLRHEAVLDEVRVSGARTAIDLGCGPGALLAKLKDERGLAKVVGVDVSHRSLERAVSRLRLDKLTESQRNRFEVFQGALTYRDARMRNFDVGILMEVIEHLDASRLAALEEVVFGDAKPTTVLVTTPNIEHNVRFEGLEPGQLRHDDHRFEWTRSEFASWAEAVAERRGYEVRYRPIGDDDPEVGPPTQMAIFVLGTGADVETDADEDGAGGAAA